LKTKWSIQVPRLQNRSSMKWKSYEYIKIRVTLKIHIRALW
jgi:hypothetical protein